MDIFSDAHHWQGKQVIIYIFYFTLICKISHASSLDYVNYYFIIIICILIPVLKQFLKEVFNKSS